MSTDEWVESWIIASIAVCEVDWTARMCGRGFVCNVNERPEDAFVFVNVVTSRSTAQVRSFQTRSPPGGPNHPPSLKGEVDQEERVPRLNARSFRQKLLS